MLLSAMFFLLVIFVSIVRAKHSDYMYGILDESLSALTFAYTEGSLLETRNLTLLLSKYERLETRASLICFKTFLGPCRNDVIEYYRKTLIEPYISDDTELVPRNLAEGLQMGLMRAEIDSITQFVTLLSPKMCDSEEATRSLKKNLKTTFAIGERHVWQNRNFGTNTYYIDLHRAYAPCFSDTYWWMQGSWHAVPMYAHDGNRDIIVSKCTGEVLQSEIRECSVTDTFLKNCVDSYFPLCPDYLKSLHRNTSSSLSVELSTNCIMYSIGVAGVYLVEDYIASAYNCEVHAFDYTYHENNEKHSHKNVYYHFIGLHSKNSSIDYTKETIYGSVSGDLMTFGELDQYLKTFRLTSSKYVPTEQSQRFAANKVRMLKMDCEGYFENK